MIIISLFTTYMETVCGLVSRHRDASFCTGTPEQEWKDMLARRISFSGVLYRALKVSAFLCCACMCDACSTFIPLCHQILPKHQQAHWDRHFRGQMSPSLVMELLTSKQWEPAPVWKSESPLFLVLVQRFVSKVQIKEGSWKNLVWNYQQHFFSTIKPNWQLISL